MNCNNCGKEFEGAFCPYCGVSQDGFVICPACGKQNQKDYSYCLHCGTPLHRNGSDAESESQRAKTIKYPKEIQGWENPGGIAWTRFLTPFLTLAFFVLNLCILFSDYLRLENSIFGSSKLRVIDLLTRTNGNFYLFYGEFDSPELLGKIQQYVVIFIVLLTAIYLIHLVCVAGRFTAKTKRTDIIFSALFAALHTALFIMANIAKREGAYFSGLTDDIHTSSFVAMIISCILFILSMVAHYLTADSEEYPLSIWKRISIANVNKSGNQGEKKQNQLVDVLKNVIKLVLAIAAIIVFFIFLGYKLPYSYDSISGVVFPLFSGALVLFIYLVIYILLDDHKEKSSKKEKKPISKHLENFKIAVPYLFLPVLFLAGIMVFAFIDNKGGLAPYFHEHFPDTVLNIHNAEWAVDKSIDKIEASLGKPFEKTDEYIVYCSSDYRKLYEEKEELYKQLSIASNQGNDQILNSIDLIEEKMENLCYSYLKICSDGTVIYDTRHRISSSFTLSERGYSWNKKNVKKSIMPDQYCTVSYTDGSFIRSTISGANYNEDGSITVCNIFGEFTMQNEMLYSVSGRSGPIKRIFSDGPVVLEGVSPYLMDLIIQKDITIINVDELSKRSSFTNITVEKENTFFQSEGNCLIETGSKTLILGCNNSTIPLDGSVKCIAKNAFYNCVELTNITIPDSVTSIGDNSFYGCSSLTSITFNGTKAQWNVISKGNNWNYNTGAYSIHCTDGDITK